MLIACCVFFMFKAAVSGVVLAVNSCVSVQDKQSDISVDGRRPGHLAEDQLPELPGFRPGVYLH
jgi:hypothetical protein